MCPGWGLPGGHQGEARKQPSPRGLGLSWRSPSELGWLLCVSVGESAWGRGGRPRTWSGGLGGHRKGGHGEWSDTDARGSRWEWGCTSEMPPHVRDPHPVPECRALSLLLPTCPGSSLSTSCGSQNEAWRKRCWQIPDVQRSRPGLSGGDLGQHGARLA